MPQVRALLRRPVTIMITVVAATDIAYRLLIRDSLRRVLGIDG